MILNQGIFLNRRNTKNKINTKMAPRCFVKVDLYSVALQSSDVKSL